MTEEQKALWWTRHIEWLTNGKSGPPDHVKAEGRGPNRSPSLTDECHLAAWRQKQELHR